MNADDTDALSQALAEASSGRRSLLAGLIGLVAAGRLHSGADAGNKKRRRRRRRRRKQQPQNPCDAASGCGSPPTCDAADVCGVDCCAGDRCFEKTLNGDTGEAIDFGCCPDALLCKSPRPNYEDQCCYPDETCDPDLLTKQPDLNTVCCRPCGGKCINFSEECVDGVPVQADTARLPRYRR